jgi:uncharacterized protein YndB with AHSA1/START domain
MKKKRSVQLDFEVPGSPEQVWHAIATGPGISSWLFPTKVDERKGGAIEFNIGPGMESSGTVTAWEPPSRFAYEEPNWSGNAPPLGTEFVIEAKSGGKCIVRLVHSLDTDSDEWDEQIEGFETGWPSFFHVLRLYVSHFFGQPCSPLRVMGNVPGPEATAWEELVEDLGLTGVRVGDYGRTKNGPKLAGTVERCGEGKHPNELTLRLDEPAPGIALLGAYSWGGQVHISLSLYLFGNTAEAVLAREGFLWREWMESRAGVLKPN